MRLEAVNILQIVFIVQACFGILLVINQTRYRGLVWILSCATLLMVFNLLEETGLTRDRHLVTPVFSLLSGPVYYLFVYHLIYNNQKPISYQYLHLLPAIAALPFTAWTQSILILGSLSQLIYIIVCVRLILRYHQATLSHRSDAYSLKLSWIIKILGVIVVTEIIDLSRLNLQPYLALEILNPWYFIMQSIFFLLISALIYKAIRQPVLFDGLAQYEQLQTIDQTNPANLTHAKIIFNELDQLLKTSKLYRQARLSLRELAEKTGFSEKDISSAINRVSQKNFCDYINSLRVYEVQTQLANKQQNRYSLLEIALDSGFSSKSTFNAAFKRETGMTPSQFIKEQSSKLT